MLSVLTWRRALCFSRRRHKANQRISCTAGYETYEGINGHGALPAESRRE